MVKDQLDDFTIRVLLIAATISIIIGVSTSEDGSGWVEGTSIYFACLLIISLQTLNDYFKNRQFIKLLEQIKDVEVSAIRGQHGTTSPVINWDLVVGDIINIEAGMRIPADCVLIEGLDVVVDEDYYYNGVNTFVPKLVATADNKDSNPDPFLRSNCLVTEGVGKAVVLAVGNLSQRGKMEANRKFEEEPITKLQEKLERIGSQVGKYGIYSALIIFFMFTGRKVIDILFTDSTILSGSTITALISYFILGITIIMVVVPEGLPLSVSISGAFSLDKMKEKQLLVKRLEATEKMGCVGHICTGKTGTLTQEDMKVSQIYVQQ